MKTHDQTDAVSRVIATGARESLVLLALTALSVVLSIFSVAFASYVLWRVIVE